MRIRRGAAEARAVVVVGWGALGAQSESEW